MDLAVAFAARSRALGHDEVALRPVVGAQRPDVYDLALGHHVDAAPLGEPEIVLDERVLGPLRAADHAAPTARAAGALRPLAAEEGIGHRLARLAEEDADAG